MWSKKSKFLLAAGIIAMILLGGAVLTTGLLIPFTKARNAMDPNGLLTVNALADGSYQLRWPEGSNASGYGVQIRATDGTVLYSTYTEACETVVPQLPIDRNLTIRVSSIHIYDGISRRGSVDLVAKVEQLSPQVQNLNWEVDDRYDTVDISFEMSDTDVASVYVVPADGEPVLVEQVRNGNCQLRFGVDDLFQVPEYGKPLRVAIQLERRTGNVVCTGSATEEFTLTREDFLGRTLNVEQSYNGNNSYTLTWNETKGAYYDVRLSEDGGESWTTIGYIPADRERSFTTPCLKAFADYQISVVAVGGQTMEDSETAAEGNVLQLATSEKLLYSTIWPLKELKVYGDKEITREIGTVSAGSAWCVLGQEGNYLKIRYLGQDGFIDGNYCMINLPEYIGNLCAYDITNSYKSIYLVHEYGIKDVSGTVITGYENVLLGEDQYLVPLIFPAAQRLIGAGLDARSRGYTLKIYDSFRPQNATDDIYKKTQLILGSLVPSQTFSGKKVTDLHLVNWGPAEGEEAAENVEYGPLTYRRMMTNNGAFSLSVFLAPGVSRHNYGLALDLTLQDAQGEELPMQTSIHDLSWYSCTERNNANANLLHEIMTGAGFNGIYSEWWHYQDNHAYYKYGYPTLRTGISCQCLVADHNGWRYRLADGSFHANCTQTIDGESCSFDENGYLVK